MFTPRFQPAWIRLALFICWIAVSFRDELICDEVSAATTGAIETADETVYRDRPYWYKPGHPLHPAEAATVRTLPGFVVERILTVPTNFGSFTALAADPKGRLLAASQHEPGIFRISPARAGETGAETRVERLSGAANKVGWSHGLLWAFNSLYVTVAEGNSTAKTGLYRLRDTRGEDQFDQLDLLFELKGGGEHGPHSLVPGPDGRSLYLMGGNGTALPPEVNVRRPVVTDGLDRLMPPGFEPSKHAIEGWVVRFDPSGKNRELFASGLRNSFDLAFNTAGDLFTFDSDMEWDLGTPWYRPTRVCHIVSGSEFGWRGGSAMWPEHYEDSVKPVINIGPSSPTGVTFGYGAKFPARYQRAFFACDWTFATIHAVHLIPEGATYRAEVEEFVGGTGLPVTDVVVAGDGSLYFAVGGRRLGSAIYRVRYTGGEETMPATEPALPPHEAKLHSLRRELESDHGRTEPSAIEKAWPHLGHTDRAIRFAARIAVEKQPVDQWKARALSESNVSISLAAMLALARQGSREDQRAVLERLVRLPWDGASTEWKLRWLRACELALARGGPPAGNVRQGLTPKLRTRFNDPEDQVRRDISRLLCSLGDPMAIDLLLRAMELDPGERPGLGSGNYVRNPKYGAAVKEMLQSAPKLQRMHYAQMLLWPNEGWTRLQREKYFGLIADAQVTSRGGHQYREMWERIRGAALKDIPEGERKVYAEIRAEPKSFAPAIPAPKGPGREWTMDAALNALGSGLKGRDPVKGSQIYAAVGCALCHAMEDEGGSIGPDLSTVGKRFTLRDVLEATLEPSKAVSDQYQIVTLELQNGKSISGRLVSRGETTIRIATDLMRPSAWTEVASDAVRKTRPEPVSTMPSGLLNSLNGEELGDLMAYVMGERKAR